MSRIILGIFILLTACADPVRMDVGALRIRFAYPASWPEREPTLYVHVSGEGLLKSRLETLPLPKGATATHHEISALPPGDKTLLVIASAGAQTLDIQSKTVAIERGQAAQADIVLADTARLSQGASSGQASPKLEVLLKTPADLLLLSPERPTPLPADTFILALAAQLRHEGTDSPIFDWQVADQAPLPGMSQKLADTAYTNILVLPFGENRQKLVKSFEIVVKVTYPGTSLPAETHRFAIDVTPAAGSGTTGSETGPTAIIEEESTTPPKPIGSGGSLHLMHKENSDAPTQ